MIFKINNSLSIQIILNTIFIKEFKESRFNLIHNEERNITHNKIL